MEGRALRIVLLDDTQGEAVCHDRDTGAPTGWSGHTRGAPNIS